MSKKRKKIKPGDLTGNASQWAGIEFSQQGGLLLPKPAPEDEESDEDLQDFVSDFVHQFLDDKEEAPVWGIQCEELVGAFGTIVAGFEKFVAQNDMRDAEQEILRKHNKTRMQYAWSDVLKAHVPIGEPL